MRRFLRQHFVEQRSKRIDIARDRDRLAARLLGRHTRRRKPLLIHRRNFKPVLTLVQVTWRSRNQVTSARPRQ